MQNITSKFRSSVATDELVQIGAGSLPRSYDSLAAVGLWALLHSRKVRILVLDDLERKHKCLDTEELFGFADFLSEKSDVQIIFISNLEKLANKQGASLRKDIGIEKAISHEICLKPDINSIANIAVSDSQFSEHILEPLRTFCLKSEIDNIRLLKRAVAHIDRFLNIVATADFNDVISYSDVVCSYLGLVFARFSDKFNLRWEEARALCDVGVLPTFLKEQPDRSRDALNFAQKIGFPNVAYPELVIRHVESGLLDFHSAIERLEELRDSTANRRSVNDSALWASIWETYGNSMSENEEHVAELIDRFLNEDASLLDVRSYHQLESLAEAVGKDISSYEHDVHLRNVEVCPREDLPRLLDHYKGNGALEEAVKNRMNHEMSARSISDVARKALNQQGWSQADEYEIFSRNEDEIEDWLMQEEEDKPDLIRQVIRMDKRNIVKPLIKRLAGESKLNKMRSTKIYDIDTD